MKAPSEAELAGAKVYVRRPDAQVPVDAEWYVLTDGRVLTRYPSGGWAASMFTADALAIDGGDWLVKQ